MKLISCLFAFFLTSASLLAQNATLRGQITDESGAVIPGATVTLKGPSGFVKTSTTGNDGSYSFTGLTPGSYTVQASAPELAMPQPAKINLRTGNQSLNLQLKVAATTQQVTIQEQSGPTVSPDPCEPCIQDDKALPAMT